MRSLLILGIRGIPAQHGGFETFAEKLSLYLAERGWSVTVYCQDDGGTGYRESWWQGIRCIHIPVSRPGSLGSVVFDWKATCHALRNGGESILLTLGYNTAIFSALHRISGQTNLINMDGIEWRRAKWGVMAKAWFWLNERIACFCGNRLIADHPDIKSHLVTRVSDKKIEMIPYGADELVDADVALIDQYGLRARGYSVVIARPEPENSVLEIVRAFSRSRRNHCLVILGDYDPGNDYQKEVLNAASDEVLFLGAIYSKPEVNALRFFSLFYIHGHQVGGTNPSLVEGLGAGCAVIAHDNVFNRWVAGDAAYYFASEASCSRIFDEKLRDFKAAVVLGERSRARHRECFTWPNVLVAYEKLLIEQSEARGSKR